MSPLLMLVVVLGCAGAVVGVSDGGGLAPSFAPAQEVEGKARLGHGCLPRTHYLTLTSTKVISSTVYATSIHHIPTTLVQVLHLQYKLVLQAKPCSYMLKCTIHIPPYTCTAIHKRDLTKLIHSTLQPHMSWHPHIFNGEKLLHKYTMFYTHTFTHRVASKVPNTSCLSGRDEVAAADVDGSGGDADPHLLPPPTGHHLHTGSSLLLSVHLPPSFSQYTFPPASPFSRFPLILNWFSHYLLIPDSLHSCFSLNLCFLHLFLHVFISISSVVLSWISPSISILCFSLDSFLSLR